MFKQKAFTLVELIVVIVLLGILAVTAAPKFIDFTEDAEQAAFEGVAAAFKNGVEQVHLAWLIRGNNRAVQDFIEISNPLADPARSGDNFLSVNSAGYPADTRGGSLALDTPNDCLDVWWAVLATQDVQVNLDDSADFEAVYDSGSCTYTYNKQSDLTILYNSNTGDVTINNG